MQFLQGAKITAQLLGPFYGAIAVPFVTRCRCRRCCCCGHRRAAARSGEWAQHFANASCFRRMVSCATVARNFRCNNGRLIQRKYFRSMSSPGSTPRGHPRNTLTVPRMSARQTAQLRNTGEQVSQQTRCPQGRNTVFT